MQTSGYQFNADGNFTAVANSMAESANRFTDAVKETNSWLGELNQTLTSLSATGKSLDRQMRELSAATDITGDALKRIETYARDTAKTFGIDASQAVEGYRLLLEQLSPELGKYPEALQAMAGSIATVGKLMGGDAATAAQTLITAMNQYGVSLDDPLKASEEMARMMNVMAAAGATGSAALPAIGVALGQCGEAAHAANVSFEETNAAIQLLDQAGLKGAEGGRALHNVLAALTASQFLPDQILAELQQAGVQVDALTDKTLPLSSRLEALVPVLSNNALMVSLFGESNATAARTLIQGADNLQGFTAAVTGTSAAEEQAAAIMDSYAERQAGVNLRIEEFRISLSQATGDLGLWLSALMNMLSPFAQLLSMLTDAGTLMQQIKGIQWAAMWSRIQGFILSARLQMALMNRELVTGQFASNGFLINITRATLAVVRFATVGILQAIKGLGALLLSFVTGGTASAAFAATASTSFSAFRASAVSACRAVGVAIMNIPIIGWIAAAVAALVALGAYFWKTSAQFRAVLKGLWAAFKSLFTGIGELAKTTFGAIGDLLTACFRLDAKGIGAALDKLKGGFADYGSQIGKAFNDAYDTEMAAAKKEEDARKQQKKDANPNNPAEVLTTDGLSLAATPDPTGGSLGTAGTGQVGSGSIRNISIRVDKLVERFEIHTTNLTEDAGKIRDLVSDALLSALNDVNLAM